MTHAFDRRLHLVIAAAIGGCLVSACHRNPEKVKDGHLRAGDAYASQKKYREAIIEFRGAVQAVPRSGPAHLKLSEAYFSAGDAVNGAREQLRGADLMPDDARAQLKAGSVLLLAGQFDRAKDRAEKLLARDARNIDARILLGTSLAALKDLDGAIAQIDATIEQDPRRSASYTTLGGMQMAKGDRDRAEASFRHAVEVAPGSIDAVVALANFEASIGNMTEAEQWLTRAVALDPSSAAPHRALATFYLGTGRQKEAEPHLKALADNSPAVGPNLVLADYYRATGHADVARKLLDAIAKDPDGAVAAQTRIASMQYSAGNKAEAHAAIDAVLAKRAHDPQAQLVKAGFLATEHRYTEALDHATIAVASAPQLPAAHVMVGSLNALRGQTDEAIRSFERVLALRPGLPQADVALARLYAARNDWASARVHAASAVKEEPRSVDAHVQLARALVESRNLTAASAELKWLATAAPDDPSVQYAFGRYYTLTGDAARARTSLTAAMNASAEIAPVAALVALNLDQGRHDEARALVDGRLRVTPDSPALLVLAAGTYDASGDPAAAEATLRKAITIDPSYLDAYQALARLFVVHARLDEARQEFETIALRNPKSVGAHTMAAVLLEHEGKRAAAQKHYEQALAIDAHAGVAANNLSWMLAENGGSLDVALQLAQTAKAALPDSPQVSDTLGWIYYRKGLTTLATRSFKESVAARPDNAVYREHLKLASERERSLVGPQGITE